MTAPKLQHDPAGLDELLLAFARGGTRWLERMAAAKLGRPVQLWDGADGLGAVLKEEMERRGVPNKRLPELVTPRSILEGSGVVRKKKQLRRAR